MEEIWKDVPDYEGLYQVSSLGRIKSLKYGREKILKLIVNSSGYLTVGFYKIKNVKQTKSVHQLVAVCFLHHKICGFKLVVDHINDNKLDNRVQNLQIVTHRFNTHKTQGKYSSLFKGVYWDNYYRQWSANIQISKKRKFLGRFYNEYDAHLAYQKALQEYNLN